MKTFAFVGLLTAIVLCNDQILAQKTLYTAPLGIAPYTFRKHFPNGIAGTLDTIKLKALLHIQKFVEDDGSGMAGLGLPPGAWKPVPDSGAGGDDAKLYIQTGSKMNDLPFSEEEETPF